MRREALAVEGAALADDKDGSQRGHARAQMHDDAAGEVHHAHLVQKSTAPHPMNEGDIHQQAPQHEEDQVRAEADAIGKGAADERGRDDREHQLEEEEGQEGHRGRVDVIGGDADALQADQLEVADHATSATTVGQAEAYQDPDDGDNAHGDEALHHDGEHVLAADQPAIEERQARSHEEDERGADEDESGVSGVEGTHACSPLNSFGRGAHLCTRTGNDHHRGAANVTHGCVLVNRRPRGGPPKRGGFFLPGRGRSLGVRRVRSAQWAPLPEWPPLPGRTLTAARGRPSVHVG